MSAWPRGSHISAVRRWSKCSFTVRRRSRMVAPPRSGNPPVMTRNGSPPVWRSIAVMRCHPLGGRHRRIGARLSLGFLRFDMVACRDRKGVSPSPGPSRKGRGNGVKMMGGLPGKAGRPRAVTGFPPRKNGVAGRDPALRGCPSSKCIRGPVRSFTNRLPGKPAFFPVGAAFQPRRSRLNASPTKTNTLVAAKAAPRAVSYQTPNTKH